MVHFTHLLHHAIRCCNFIFIIINTLNVSQKITVKKIAFQGYL